MRPGLIMAGAALTAVGLLVLGIGLINLPTSTPSTTTTTVSTLIVAGGDYEASVGAPAGATSQAGLSVQWGASGGVESFVLGCDPHPPQAPPTACILAQSSPNASSGQISYHPATNWPYVVYVLDLGKDAVNIEIIITSTTSTSSGLPWWETTGVLLAGGLLAIIGAIGAFLGYFLKGNPYRGPPSSEAQGAPKEGSSEKAPKGGPEASGEGSAEATKDEDKVFW